eukprot:TRINITY_DN446_c0_g2_i1.p1 TRINITY_DN446_c0_g2~~TRINITY_DN446_c0_g2_i1.p1  ORF type:complete len:177 (+),score=30.66 TRINITY_DN446_c0_g2_i1:43-531(+)
MNRVLFLFLSVCLAGVHGQTNDDWCFDKERGVRVPTADCAHNCCVNGDCGSSSECKAAIAVGLIILFVVLGVCCVAIVVGVMCCTQTGCFKPKAATTTIVSTGLTAAPQNCHVVSPYQQLPGEMPPPGPAYAPYAPPVGATGPQPVVGGGHEHQPTNIAVVN